MPSADVAEAPSFVVPLLAPSPASISTAGPSKQERKALKRQKAKEKKDDRDEIDKALQELSIKFVPLPRLSYGH